MKMEWAGGRSGGRIGGHWLSGGKGKTLRDGGEERLGEWIVGVGELLCALLQKTSV